MKKYTGKFGKFLVTGCSALVLSLLNVCVAYADDSAPPAVPKDQPTMDGSIPNIDSKLTKDVTVPKAAPKPSTDALVPNPDAKPSTGALVPNPDAKPSTGALVPNPDAKPSTDALVPNPDAKRSTDALAPTTDGTASTNAPVMPSAPQITVPSDAKLKATTFVHFIEAVTDKPVSQEMKDLLQGVVSMERKGNDLELTKEDGTKTMVGGKTHIGATVIGDFTDARDKVAAKFGPEVGALIDEFVGVTSNGSHLEVIRNGPELEEIDLSEKKIKRQLPLKRVRLSKISVDVDCSEAHPVLRNITGVEAVPNAGFEIPIVLKEFSRTKNQDGDDVFTFGVKNPFPLIKPFKRLFGIKEIMPVTWTVKKQDTSNKEIGAKDSAERKE